MESFEVGLNALWYGYKLMMARGRKELGVVALLEEVCDWEVGFEVSKSLSLSLSLSLSHSAPDVVVQTPSTSICKVMTGESEVQVQLLGYRTSLKLEDIMEAQRPRLATASVAESIAGGTTILTSNYTTEQ